MINLHTETLIPLSEVPRRLPPRPSGKRVHISACYRWASTGVRGVRLETVKVGGSTYTSLEAVQRFAEALNAQARPESAHANGPTPRSRARALQSAASRLEVELRMPPGRLSAPVPEAGDGGGGVGRNTTHPYIGRSAQ